MKKIILISIAVFFIILSTFIMDKKNSKKVSIRKSQFITYNHYTDSYKSRYKEFAKNNPNLSLDQVITRVNIGIDKVPYTNTKKSKYLNKEYILVNKYTYLPSDYIPNNLEFLDISYAKEGMCLVDIAKDSFEKMYQDAKKKGIRLRIISSYRSYLYQKHLYSSYKKKDGEEMADKYSAREGFSEHQTGLAVDIDDGVLPYEDFEKSNSYNWIINNSYKYGFILRYPKGKEDITGYTYESWHYRYVGKQIAKYIFDNNITFDEYYVKFIETKENT